MAKTDKPCHRYFWILGQQSYALAASTGSYRENKGDEFWEGEFVVTGEIFWGLFL